jgi:AhpD family alkylhydroperoxidase
VAGRDGADRPSGTSRGIPEEDTMDGAPTPRPPPLAVLAEAARPAFEAFHRFHSAAERADGAIPAKYRGLMAVAVAPTTRCRRRVERHSRCAREAGATREELAEAVFVAAAVRAGGAVVHGLRAVRAGSGQPGRTP